MSEPNPIKVDMTVAENNQLVNMAVAESGEMFPMQHSEVVISTSTDYDDLFHKPSINGVTLVGALDSAELELQDRLYLRVGDDTYPLNALGKVTINDIDWFLMHFDDGTVDGYPVLLATSLTMESFENYIGQLLSGKQDTLTFDDTPSEDSANPVTSGGVYEALQGKQDTISDLAAIRTGAALGATAVQHEVDPTVPSWAKASSKPTYTASEVGALPDSTVIPSKTSQLENDSGFITSAPVSSVNGRTGAVTGLAEASDIPTVPTNVSAFNNDAHYLHGNTKGVFYGTSTTTASTAEKAVTCAEFASSDKVIGSLVYVMFGHTNTADVSTLKLNVNSTGAKPIKMMQNGSLVNLPGKDYLQTAMVYPFYYDGDYWICIQNHFPVNVSELSNDSGYVNSTQAASAAPVQSVNGQTGAVDALATAKSGDTTYTALRSASIPWGKCDGTSTATAFTATIPGITEYRDGVSFWLKNGVITSATGFTININGLGAKHSYNNMTAGTADTTIFNINYTMLFVYDETLDSGAGGFYCYRGYDANTNTIGYQLRTNSSTLPASQKFYRYRLLFTSADGTKWVPANTSSSTNATASRTPNSTPIDPFGEIVYYGSTSAVDANANVSVAAIWQEYTLTLGYSFNNTGAALVLPYPKPIYLVCDPQTDGSAVINSTTPYATALPTTEDGKIYIFLGRTYSATSIELVMKHPVYYYKNNAVRQWTGPV